MPDDIPGPSLDKELEEHRRRSRGDGGGSDSGCDGCDGCDLPCDGCDLLLFVRLSSLLLLVAAVVPERGGAAVVVRAALRFYRRRLTRFTPACPSTPSCSAYATAAVGSLGVRRGLAAAAHRLRACGQASSRPTTRST